MSEVGSTSWSDSLNSILQNGLNSAIDRYLGPETAYQTPAPAPVSGGSSAPESAYRPVDATPGEGIPPMQNTWNTQNIALAGVGIALALGVIVYIARG